MMTSLFKNSTPSTVTRIPGNPNLAIQCLQNKHYNEVQG